MACRDYNWTPAQALVAWVLWFGGAWGPRLTEAIATARPGNTIAGARAARC